MIIAILTIILGIWMTRWAKQFEAQRRKEVFDRWEFKKKMTDNTLIHLDALKRDRVQILQVMSDRISYVEDKKVC